MPRYAREYQKSYSNVYHVILRSINQQEIFYDNIDRSKFLKGLKESKEKYQHDLYAYVLMDNHIHLLIMDKENNLSKIVQSLATSYALYFNKKYERIGHVFYNRFKSKQIETLSYFLNLVRYIHFNPEKAGICEYNKYNWSSYQEYCKISQFVDSNKVLKMAEMDEDDFKDFHEEYRRLKKFIVDNFEIENIQLDDETAIQMIKKVLGIENLVSIQNLNVNKRNEKIAHVAKIEGIQRKQLARILGVSERLIYRAVKSSKIDTKK